MALNQATIKATILTEMQTVYGAPEDADKADDFAEIMSQVLMQVLTSQASVTMAGGGLDSNGDSLVLNQGTIG